MYFGDDFLFEMKKKVGFKQKGVFKMEVHPPSNNPFRMEMWQQQMI